jgi:7-cyano-7-deazaguanine synthase
MPAIRQDKSALESTISGGLLFAFFRNDCAATIESLRIGKTPANKEPTLPPLNDAAQTPPVGLLLSGGLDSAVLLMDYIRNGRRVQPFYIHTDVVWAEAERTAVRQFLARLAEPLIAEPIIFEMPLTDLYRDHWSISGHNTPSDQTPDEAVFLPGRNALLALKPLLWCQTHGISELAVAVLRGNPFADARRAFFDQFCAAVAQGNAAPLVRVTRPFASFTKADVLARAAGLPLELTFSCISPRDGQHCGRCNKCGERRQVFAMLGQPDPTVYRSSLVV